MKVINKDIEAQNNKAHAMECFGKLVILINKDPDPKAQDKYCNEYNCANCDTYKYCCKLADTLQ